VLVVPKAGSGVAEHFAHTFRFASHVGRRARAAVIVERLVGTQPASDPEVEVHVQRQTDRGFLPRMAELVWLAVRLRRKGFRSFFVRTSQTAAVPIIVLRRLMGGRVLYWSCGELQKRGLREIGLGNAIRSEIPLRLAFRWADAVVTGTESLASHYSRAYAIPHHRLAVLPNEIDLEWFVVASADERKQRRKELGVTNNDPVVLSVHRLSPLRRTQLYLPSVLEYVAGRHPNVHFILAGGGPEEDEVRNAIAHSFVSDRVRMLGFVPHDQVRKLYAGADLFMMPSYTEGFPRVLLEAMATGVPIASTDVGGVREIVPSVYHTRLADRDRPMELATAIDELLADRRFARDLADEGIRWVQRFDAPIVADRLAALAFSESDRGRTTAPGA
jgi:glycosyltransferase involved in cell wall biosynthesis